MSALSVCKQHLLARVLQPLVCRLPTSLWSVTALLLAAAMAPVVAVRNKTMLQRVLRICRRQAGFSATCALAARMSYHRLRKLDYYLHGGCREVHIDWNGAPPETRRCVYVLMDTYGVEQFDAFLKQLPSWLLRRRFDDESEALADARAHTQPWSLHCARLRLRINETLTIDIHADPLKMRHAINSPHPIAAFQGFAQASQNDSSDRVVLGQAVSMPLGAARLARRAGLPIRFVSVKPQLGHWSITVEPAICADTELLQARMERALVESPETWSLWADFLAAADHGSTQPKQARHDAVAPDGAVQALSTGAAATRAARTSP